MKSQSFAFFFLFGILLGQTSLFADEGATVTGKIFVPRGSAIKFDLKTLEISIEEQITYDDPPRPDNFESMSIEERQAYFKKYFATEEGKAYQAKQKAKFDARKKYKIKLDENGKFEVEDVAAGPYMILGAAERKIGGKTYQIMVHGELKIDEAKRVELEPLPVDINRFLTKGEKAPEFNIRDVDGNKIDSESLAGKYSLVYFWHSKSEPCQDDIVKIKELQNAMKSHQAFQIFAVSVDDASELDSVKQSIKTHRQTWIHASAGGFDEKITFDYGVRGIPAYWLVSKDGVVLLTNQDFTNAIYENKDFHVIVEEAIKEHEAKK